MAAGAAFVGAVATGNPALAATALKIAGIASAIGTVSSPPSDHVARKPVRKTDRMTAISMFALGRRAFVVTDGAAFDVRDGRIASLGPKVVMFSALSMTIAFQGWGDPEGFVEAMAATDPKPTQESFLGVMPTALAQYRLAQDVTPLVHTRLCVAFIDQQSRAARFCTVSSGLMPDQDRSDIYQLQEVGSFYTGFAHWQEPEQLINGDPISGGRRLLDAQRRHSAVQIGGRCGVGGEGALYTLDRRGVSYRPLIRYPELPGGHADPRNPGEIVNASPVRA